MHTLTRRDASLATALVISAFVLFHQPLKSVLEFVREVEVHYSLDFLPASVVLVVTFGIQQYRRRRQLMVERETAMARLGDLNRLLTFGRAVTGAFDDTTLLQTLCRFLPTFAGERGAWLLVQDGSRWVTFLNTTAGSTSDSDETLERRAIQAVHSTSATDAPDGVIVDDDVCYSLTFGSTVVGVLGIRNSPVLMVQEREGVAAASTFIALTIRHLQELHQLRRRGHLDELTGCLNRTAGLAALQGELKRARRTSGAVSILMIDVDQFKTINDTSGHLEGDAVLRDVGARIRGQLRTTDAACRYGGDEFLIILPDTPPGGARLVADKLRRGVSEAAHEARAAVTVSIGVATADRQSGMVALLARADAALYEAKEGGRNRVAVASLQSEVTSRGSATVRQIRQG